MTFQNLYAIILRNLQGYRHCYFDMSPTEVLVKKLESDYGIQINDLIKEILKYMPDFNETKFRKAYSFAADAHQGQMRRENKPYIYHPLETAKILSSLHVDEDTLLAALLHDVPEDTSKTIEEIESKFGKRVAFLVEGVTKLSKVHYQNNMAQRQVDSLKKLFIHSAQDPRIILIKLADRLHNMRTLQFHDNPEKRKRIANETMEIFVPITNLLGIEEIKNELEDLCFKYINPDEYASLAARMQEIREKNAPVLEETINLIEQGLRKNNISASVFGRIKNLYGIYKKVVTQQRKLEEFDNLICLRILVPEKSQCYEALGIVHSLFVPKTGKFKDYIAMPKINGYQSLHTTTFGLHGYTTEVQIRTNQMHLEDEYGIAAHYFLKSNKSSRQILEEDKRSDWANKISEITKDEDLNLNLLEELKLDILRDRIFVFTPKGDTIDLPQGATCIDFAYNIHTEIGEKALKADVNGDTVPMSTVLQNGDTVKIITCDYEKGPDRSWLGFVKTNYAKNKIKDYFRRISREEKIRTGKSLLQKEMDRAGLGLIKELPSKKIREFLIEHDNYNSLDDIFAGIAEGGIKPIDFLNLFYPDKHVTLGHFNLLEGKLLKSYPEKGTTVSFKIISKDTFCQLEKIMKVFMNMKVIIIKQKSYISKVSNNLVCRFIVRLKTFSQVSQLFENLEQVEGIKKVSRIFWQRKLMFVLVSMFTFIIWAIHPFVLHYISVNLVSSQHPYISSMLLYVGIFMLFMMVFLLKTITQRSFPELRESTTFWVMTYLLSTFALITLFAEIYFFHLTFNWVFIFGLIILIFAYLTSEYLSYRDRL